jgi:hypothetical protein
VTLIQVLPAFVPMQYNTALGLLLCGAGLLAVLFGRGAIPKCGYLRDPESARIGAEIGTGAAPGHFEVLLSRWSMLIPMDGIFHGMA